MAHWPAEKKEGWHEFKVVVRGFRKWLEASGWTVEVDTEDDIDIVATRGNETIIAEAKGLTSGGGAKGIHTVYGQILRRMTSERVADPNTRFAVVVNAKAAAGAIKVPVGVRDLLRITVYSVSDDGHVDVMQG